MAATEWTYNPDEFKGLSGSNCTFVLPASPGGNVTHHPDGVCLETGAEDGLTRQTGLRLHSPTQSSCAGGTGDVEILRACRGTGTNPIAGAQTPCNTTGPNGCAVCSPLPNLRVTCHSPGLDQAIAYLRQLLNAGLGTPLADKLEDVIGKADSAAAELWKTPPDRQAAAGNMEGAVGDLEAAVGSQLLLLCPGR